MFHFRVLFCFFFITWVNVAFASTSLSFTPTLKTVNTLKQTQTATWEFKVSTSNVGPKITQLTASVLDNGDSDKVIDKDKYDLVVSLAGTTLLDEESSGSLVKSSLDLLVNEVKTFEIQIALKDQSSDPCGFNLVGKQLHPKLTFKIVSGNTTLKEAEDYVDSSKKTTVANGIKGMQIDYVRGDFNLLVPGETAVLLRVSADVNDAVALSKFSVFKEAEYAGSDDPVLKTVSLIRGDQLKNDFPAGNNIDQPKKLSFKDVTDSVNRLTKTNSLQQSILNLNSNNLKFQAGTSTNVFFLVYQLKEDALSTKNYKVRLDNIEFKVGDISFDVSGNVLRDTLGASAPYLNNSRSPEKAYDVIQMGLDDVQIPQIQVNSGVISPRFSGGSLKVPVIAFDVLSTHNQMELVTLNLSLSGDVFKFSQENGNQDQNIITAVHLYHDVNKDAKFDSGDVAVKKSFTTSTSDKFNIVLPSDAKSRLDRVGASDLYKKSYLLLYDIGEKLGSNVTSFQTNIESLEAKLVHGTGTVNNSDKIGGDYAKFVIKNKPGLAALSREVAQSTVSFVSINALVTRNVYQGERDVLLFDINLHNQDQDLSDVNILFRSGNQPAFSSATGVNTLYIHDQLNSAKLLGTAATSVNATQTFTVPNIFLNKSLYQQVNTLRIKADIGQESSDVLKLQFNGVSGDGLSFAGAVPAPLSSMLVTVNKVNLASLAKLTNTNAINEKDNDGTISLEVTVSNNNSGFKLKTTCIPKVYLKTKDGLDISTVFNMVAVGEGATQIIGKNNSKTFKFKLSYIDGQRFYDGTAFVDVDFNMIITGPSNNLDENKKLYFKRYEKPGVKMQSNVTFAKDDGFLVLEKSDDIDDGRYASYIHKIYYRDNYVASSVSLKPEDEFFSRSVAQEGGYFCIELTRNIDVDLSTVELTFQGVPMTQVDEGNTQKFSYYVNQDTQKSKIEIYNLPDTKGDEVSIVINVKDSFGHAFDAFSLKFMTSSVLQANRALFFPNPFPVGQSDNPLVFGLNLTKPSRLSFYVFNHNGRFIWSDVLKKSETKSGYNYLTQSKFLGLKDLQNRLVPGMYVCKVLIDADDNEGITRLIRLVVY
eukprot:COSAG01_NODE_71_length_28648_cov_1587.432449_12_plen_1095_part_00